MHYNDDTDTTQYRYLNFYDDSFDESEADREDQFNFKEREKGKRRTT